MAPTLYSPPGSEAAKVDNTGPPESEYSIGLGAMALRLVQVNFKARNDSALGQFWADALG